MFRSSENGMLITANMDTRIILSTTKQTGILVIEDACCVVIGVVLGGRVLTSQMVNGLICQLVKSLTWLTCLLINLSVSQLVDWSTC